jgi:hypothetical protein
MSTSGVATLDEKTQRSEVEKLYSNGKIPI